MKLQRLSFLKKTVYNILPTPVNLHVWGLTTCKWCRVCEKTASFKHILTECEHALRSYTRRHNKVLEIFAEAAKICCEIANKSLNNITNTAIHFIKEGNILKISCENKHRSSLLDGYTDWHIATDLEHCFVFPTVIVFMTQHPDMVIWSIKLKKVFVIELLIPFEENYDWAH